MELHATCAVKKSSRWKKNKQLGNPSMPSVSGVVSSVKMCIKKFIYLVSKYINAIIMMFTLNSDH